MPPESEPKANILQRLFTMIMPEKISLRNYFNPGYHYHRMREDLAVAWKAVRSPGFRPDLSEEECQKNFHGKLFATFFLAGMLNAIGLISGLALQAVTGSPWVGMFSTVAIGNVLATAGFQVVWWIANRRMYAHRFADPWHRLGAVVVDILPVQLHGMKWLLIFSFISIPISSTLLFLIERLAPGAARYVPGGFLYAAVDLMLVGTTFVRLMGDLFQQHALTLAQRHRSAFAGHRLTESEVAEYLEPSEVATLHESDPEARALSELDQPIDDGSGSGGTPVGPSRAPHRAAPGVVSE